MRTMISLALLLAFAPTAPLAEERSHATTTEAELMVHNAVAFLKKEGKEKALATFNDPKGAFTYGDLYVLVMRTDGTVVAHGKRKDFVGRNDVNTKDARGNYHFARSIVELAKAQGKGWVEYTIENPVTHKVETKVAYVELVNDLVVSCGVFKPNA